MNRISYMYILTDLRSFPHITKYHFNIASIGTYMVSPKGKNPFSSWTCPMRVICNLWHMHACMLKTVFILDECSKHGSHTKTEFSFINYIQKSLTINDIVTQMVTPYSLVEGDYFIIEF